jgi:hypothetical protein
VQLLAGHAGELRFARSGGSLAALDIVDMLPAKFVLVDAKTRCDLILDETACGPGCNLLGNRLAGFCRGLAVHLKYIFPRKICELGQPRSLRAKPIC